MGARADLGDLADLVEGGPEVIRAAADPAVIWDLIDREAASEAAGRTVALVTDQAVEATWQQTDLRPGRPTIRYVVMATPDVAPWVGEVAP